MKLIIHRLLFISLIFVGIFSKTDAFEDICSLEAPFDKIGNYWNISHMARFQHDWLSFIPNQPAVSSFVWCNTPIESSTLHIELTFRIHNLTENPASRGFALWILEKTNRFELPVHGGSLFGHNPEFRGLGIFFAYFDNKDELHPSISASFNDGNKHWNDKVDIPANGVHWNFRGTRNPFVLALTLDSSLFDIRGKFKGAQDWIQIAKIKSFFRESSVVAGITAESGHAIPEKATDMIEIHEFKIKGTPASYPENEDMLEAPYQENSQESSELARFNFLLKKINKIEKQIDRLLYNIPSMKESIQALVATANPVREVGDKFETVKNELMQHLSDAVFNAQVSSDAESRTSQQKMQEISSMVTRYSRTNAFLIIGFCLVMVVMGYYLYRLNRSIEKSHFL